MMICPGYFSFFGIFIFWAVRVGGGGGGGGGGRGLKGKKNP